MPTSQEAFCGVLGDDISDSMQMTANNYRKVLKKLHNRVRRQSRWADMTSESTVNHSSVSWSEMTYPLRDLPTEIEPQCPPFYMTEGVS